MGQVALRSQDRQSLDHRAVIGHITGSPWITGHAVLTAQDRQSLGHRADSLWTHYRQFLDHRTCCPYSTGQVVFGHITGSPWITEHAVLTAQDRQSLDHRADSLWTHYRQSLDHRTVFGSQDSLHNTGQAVLGSQNRQSLQHRTGSPWIT